MHDMQIDTRQIHSLTDFLRNYKVHIAHLKETRTPEVLTVNGRAEVVIMDSESYQTIIDRLHNMETIASIRRTIERSKSENDKPITPEELGRRTQVVDELTAEAEHLGLYR